MDLADLGEGCDGGLRLCRLLLYSSVFALLHRHDRYEYSVISVLSSDDIFAQNAGAVL
jgi:hypothetical protein